MSNADRIDVVQLLADGYPHLHAFDEVAASLAEALQAAGHTSELLRGTSTGPGRNVILGGHLLDDEDLSALPADTIFYNFEQIDDTSMMPPARLPRFGRFTVWEYSAKNVARWADAGVQATHVPVGWTPGLEVLDRSGPTPIDVLFYGSMNERRKAVIDELRRADLRVETRFGVYGQERDALIQRSKVVLNVQFYEARILEMVRLSYLLANAVPVVSETSADIEKPDGFDDAVAFAAYDDLVATTIDLVADEDARAGLAERGQAAMRATPWVLPGLATADSPPEAAASTSRASRPAARASASSGGGPEIAFVLGCHRSGTSMLARVVNLGGFGMTGPTIPAAEDNPKGFWEDQNITIVNDQILQLAGSRWDTIAPPGTIDVTADPRIAQLRAQLIAYLRQTPHRRVVVKDPRITLLLPFWLDLVAELGWGVRSVFAVRNPVAVAESMRIRNGFAPVKGVLLWLTYTLYGEMFSRSIPRTVIGYEDFLEAPTPTLEQLHDALAVEEPLARFRAAAAASLDASLNRSAGDDAAYTFAAAGFAQEVRTAVLAGDTDTLDAAARRYLDAQELFVPLLGGLRQAASAAVDGFS